MKPKPYDPAVRSKTRRAYRPEFLSPLNLSLPRWGFALVTAVLMAAAAIIAAKSGLAVHKIMMAALIAGLLTFVTWSAYMTNRGFYRYSKLVDAAEYVPDTTKRNLRQTKVLVRLALVLPIVYAIALGGTLASGNGDLAGTDVNVMLLLATNVLTSWSIWDGEICDVIFMADGIYTGTAGAALFFVPYNQLDAVKRTAVRQTKRGEIVDIEFFSGGEQFGHDRMYRTEFDEIERRVHALRKD